MNANPRIGTGDRVRLTRRAVAGAVPGHTKPDRVGTVLRVTQLRNRTVVVRWDGSRTTMTYSTGHLEIAP